VLLCEQNEKLRVKLENLSLLSGSILQSSPKSADADERASPKQRDWHPSSGSRCAPSLDLPIENFSKVELVALSSGCIAELRNVVAKVQKNWQAASTAREQLRGLLQPARNGQQRRCLDEMERMDALVKGMQGWANELDSSLVISGMESPQGMGASEVDTARSGMVRRSSSCARLREQVARASTDSSFSIPSKSSVKIGVVKCQDINEDRSPEVLRKSPAHEEPERHATPPESLAAPPESLATPNEEYPDGTDAAQFVRGLGDVAISAAISAQLSAQQGMSGSTGETNDTADNGAGSDRLGLTTGKDCLANLVVHADNLALDLTNDRCIEEAGQEFAGLTHFSSLRMLALDFDHCRQLKCVEEVGKGLLCLSKLQELVLQFRHCSDIANIDGLCQGFRGIKDVKVLRLDLSHCKHLCSVGELGRGLAELTALSSLVLHLSDCELLHDLTEVGGGMRNLRDLRALTLDLSNCPRLTRVQELGQGMAYLTELRSCKLNFKGCGKLQDVNALDKVLVSSREVLTTFTLDLSNCGQLASVAELKKGLQQASALQTVLLDFSSCEALPAKERCKVATLQDLKNFLKHEEADGEKKKPKAIVLEEAIDENYEPTQMEIEEYAAWLGMDLIKDRDLFWIAQTALKEPVPKPWKPCRMDNSEDIFYFNFDTGESIWDHPCDLRFKQVYEEQKRLREEKEQPDDELQEAPAVLSSARRTQAEAVLDADPLLAAGQIADSMDSGAPTAPQIKGSNVSSRARIYQFAAPSRRD
jgi:hypothetical protein